MKFSRSIFTLFFGADAGLGRLRPGELWMDDKGVPINGHGGCILPRDGVNYWFGEHRVEGDAGNCAQVAVHVYSSLDRLGWDALVFNRR